MSFRATLVSAWAVAAIAAIGCWSTVRAAASTTAPGTLDIVELRQTDQSLRDTTRAARKWGCRDW